MGAEMRLANTAMKTGAAIQFRVDDDALAGLEIAARCFHYDTNHLVAHNARVTNGNRTAINFVIGSADAAVRYADEDLPGTGLGRSYIFEGQFTWPIEHHGFHQAKILTGI